MAKSPPRVYAPHDVIVLINRLHEEFGYRKSDILREAIRLLEWILLNFPTTAMSLRRLVDDVISVLQKEAEKRKKMTIAAIINKMSR